MQCILRILSCYRHFKQIYQNSQHVVTPGSCWEIILKFQQYSRSIRGLKTNFPQGVLQTELHHSLENILMWTQLNFVAKSEHVWPGKLAKVNKDIYFFALKLQPADVIRILLFLFTFPWLEQCLSWHGSSCYLVK